MNFAIHGREFNIESKGYIQELFDELGANEINYQISESFSKILKDANINFNFENTFSTPENIFDTDLAISLGGDGSFLETLSLVAKREIPILGINFGRLGFLADIQPQNIKESLRKILSGQFIVDERLMIKTETQSPIFSSKMDFALNEIAISKTDTSSMIVVDAYVDNVFLNSYWADGLMVSTPTGSTDTISVAVGLW